MNNDNRSSNAFDLLGHYYKPIKQYLEDEHVTEVMINGPEEIYIEKSGKLQRVDTPGFEDDKQLTAFITLLGNGLNQVIDSKKNPILDARLPDGSRINAVLPPVAVGPPTITIRPARVVSFTMEDLLKFELLSQEMAEFIKSRVEIADNILISGGTGSGKTTLLRALTSYFRQDERIIVVEDTTEFIVPNHPHKVMYEAARRSIKDKEQYDEITMARLIANSLRIRPDRIVVGEIRTPAAAAAFIEALNTGHGGTISTTHANNSFESYTRLINLHAAHTPHIPYEIIAKTIKSSVQIVVNIKRIIQEDGSAVRRVYEISSTQEGEPKTLYRYNRASKGWDYFG